MRRYYHYGYYELYFTVYLRGGATHVSELWLRAEDSDHIFRVLRVLLGLGFIVYRP